MSGEVDLKKRHCFVIEKCIENVRHDEKHVPDLLELIIQPKLFVKDEARQKLFKMIQFGLKIKKINVSTFCIAEIRSFPAGGQRQPPHQ